MPAAWLASTAVRIELRSPALYEIHVRQATDELTAAE
jgi:hypothetical protein